MPGGTEHLVSPPVERCLHLYRRLAAGVTVLSARAETGPVGLTASSVTSLSLRPPLLCAGVTVGSYTLGALEQRGVFGIHLLDERQQEVAADFANPAGPRFAAHDHHDVLGVPILRDCLAWTVCALDDARRYGDHVLVVGRVVAVGLGEGRPLLWHDRAFGRLGSESLVGVPAGMPDELWNGT
jgi:flavin reductase (DIM6/NTAB) family NADH-FMN oxidoreductase RutF